MDKVNNMQEYIGNRSRGMEIPSKNQELNANFKNTVTEMKNAFYVLISRTDMAEEIISELENISIEISKMKAKAAKTGGEKEKTHKIISKGCGTTIKSVK